MADAFVFGDVVEPVLAKIEAEAFGTTGIIVNSIDDGLDDPWEFIGFLAEKINIELAPTLARLADLVDAYDFQVIDNLVTSIEATAQTVTAIEGRIESSIDAGQSATDGLLDSIGQLIGGGLDRVITEGQQIVDDVTGVVRGAIDVTLAPISLFAVEVTKDVTQLVQALSDGLPEVMTGVANIAFSALSPLGDTIEAGFKTIIGSFFEDVSEDFIPRIEPLIAMFEDDPDIPDHIKALTAPGALPAGIIGGFLAGIALPLVISNIGNVALSPWLAKMQQNLMAKVRPTILTASEATVADRRDLMDHSRARDTLERLGYQDGDLDVMLRLVEQRPGTTDLIDLWRRNIIKEVDLDQELFQIGWQPKYITLFKVAAFPPPPVQDLITMAVREVFTEEIAEKFGQFEDFPDDFGEWAEKIGIAPMWAKNYWAAHWALPSVTQGFDMLHRTTKKSNDPDADTITLPSGRTLQNVVGESTLRTLLRSQDVMPFWRDPIVDISFRPFTRVDVRRMHRLGILDDDGAFAAYIDVGYNSEKASGLLAFTKALTEGASKVATRPERDLTKGDILGLRNDGLLKDEAAEDYLVEIGFDEIEAATLVERESLQELRADRKNDISLVIAQQKAGGLTFEKATEALNALGLTQLELQKATNSLRQSIELKNRQPTKADLEEWLSKSLLTPLEFGEEVRLLRFPDKYLELYLAEKALSASDDDIAAFKQAWENLTLGQARLETVMSLRKERAALLAKLAEGS